MESAGVHCGGTSDRGNRAKSEANRAADEERDPRN